MIYFDNSATSMARPPEVGQAMQYALDNYGNPGRSFYDAAMQAGRKVVTARRKIAELVELADPHCVAFTSGATESLNLVLHSLIKPEDDVITTVLEHNSVLRPLYQLGCSIQYLDCDETGSLYLDDLPKMLKSNTKWVVATHGSNLVGSLTDVAVLKRTCDEYGLTLILDAAQTMGCVPVRADMADVICFAGHKGLMGPQGTGGIIARQGLPFKIVKTGGTGADSFAQHQPLQMPDVFEAGTANTHGIAGLCAGVEFLQKTGIHNVAYHEEMLTRHFLAGLAAMPHVIVYGTMGVDKRLPVVALNVKGLEAAETSLYLWEKGEIATRAGSHCAPLAHKRFGTVQQGMVRFSFGYFNTVEEIDHALQVLSEMEQK